MPPAISRRLLEHVLERDLLALAVAPRLLEMGAAEAAGVEALGHDPQSPAAAATRKPGLDLFHLPGENHAQALVGPAERHFDRGLVGRNRQSPVAIVEFDLGAVRLGGVGGRGDLHRNEMRVEGLRHVVAVDHDVAERPSAEALIGHARLRP